MDSQNPIESDGVSYASASRLEYEVFLSFRGCDTRAGFTDHLYVRLNDAGIRVYRDDEELRTGEKIGSEILKGINQSKIAIPIFSKGYAASKWCLKELTQIVECKRTTGLKIMPIFYDVTPSEVRNQTGCYGKAFELYHKCHDENTINDWKKALREVGEMKGWDIESGFHRRQEGELVKEVTNAVLRELKKAYLSVSNCLVGLEQHVEEVLNTLATEINGVMIVAIHGMGGIGKTTLGKVIYNHLLPYFESHCFLADIREIVRSKGIKFLQERLISSILNVKSIYSNIDEGIEIINERFYNKKVLLFLDDVDEVSQLKALMARRDRLGCGSRIIITTRNNGIFNQQEVDRSYELCGLDFHQAIQLFSQHAFRNNKPPEEYVVLSQRIIEIARGLPLALEIFGCLFCGKSKEQWLSMIKRLEKVPHKEVAAKLRISFEALDEQQKEMFLDIACFFIGENKRIAIHFWDELEFPEEAAEVLQQMSLIKIKEDHSIWMHDQLRDLGRDIVRQEHKELERHSRLWNENEGTKLLMRKLGSENIRGIILNFQGETKYSISNEEFVKLPNLRLLRVNELDYKWNIKFKLKNFLRQNPLIFSKLRWLSWHHFPHMYNTTKFSFEDLTILDLSYSNIKSGWSGWNCVKMAKNLKVLNLTGCFNLVRTPNFASHLKLEQLILRGCSSLVEIDQSISLLEHLVIIDLENCHSLCKLPKVLSCTDSLEELLIKYTLIKEIPNWPPMRRLKVFSYSYDMALTCSKDKGNVFVSRKGDLIAKEFFRGLSWAEILPKSIGDWVSLIELDLSTFRIIDLPDTIGNLKKLKVLSVESTPIRALPTVIGMLENLITLNALGCNYLVNIPKLPQSLTTLKLKCLQMPDLSNLINLKTLELQTSHDQEHELEADVHAPWWIGRLTNLESLELHHGHIISMPTD